MSDSLWQPSKGIVENNIPKSTLDCFVKYMDIGKIRYHVHDGLYGDAFGMIKDSQCTLANCSKSPNYQYEGSR